MLLNNPNKWQYALTKNINFKNSNSSNEIEDADYVIPNTNPNNIGEALDIFANHWKENEHTENGFATVTNTLLNINPEALDIGVIIKLPEGQVPAFPIGLYKVLQVVTFLDVPNRDLLPLSYDCR